jgi:hypothetical protein
MNETSERDPLRLGRFAFRPALACLLVFPLACAAPEPATQANLAVRVVVSETNDFIGEWERAPAGQPPQFTSVEHGRRGDDLSVGFFVTGFAVDDGGRVSLRLDFEAFDPTGAVTLAEDGFAVYDGPPPPGRRWLLLQGGLTWSIEESDPTGDWILEMEVTDLVSGERTESRAVVAVVP